MSDVINNLESLIQSFKTSADHEIENSLRSIRAQVASAWLNADVNNLVPEYTGELGKAHKLLLGSGFSGVALNEQEIAFTKILLKDIKDTQSSSQTLHYLLACMLYLGPHELPVNNDIKSIPAWFYDDYINFLVTPPVIFKKPGEALDYFHYLENIMHYFSDNLLDLLQIGSNDFYDETIIKLKFVLAYFNEENITGLMSMRAKLMESMLYSTKYCLDHVFPYQKTQRKKHRIGFLINALGDHTESYFALSNLAGMSRKSVEIVLYTLVSTKHQMEKHAEEMVDRYVCLDNINTSSIVQHIRNDDLDGMLFATNVTAVTNPMFILASHRLARVQISTMASPVSTGIRNMDYFLSSVFNEPVHNPQEQYTEKLIQIPGGLNHFSYQYDKVKSTFSSLERKTLGIPSEAIVFFSGANFFKILPELSEVWVKIIAKVPNSILVLMPFNPNWTSQYPEHVFLSRLTQEFEQAGIDKDRLRIINPVPHRVDVHEVIKLADIYLDSFPFAGSCSVFDPLSVGCPPVVWSGKTARSRHGATLLKMFDLEEMIAESEQDYIDKAVALACDENLKNKIIKKINHRLETGNPVLDTNTLGPRVSDAVINVIDNYHKEEDILFNRDTTSLVSEIQNLSTKITPDKPFTLGLTDAAWVKSLLLSYFKSLEDGSKQRHMVDVGACYGEIAVPFLQQGWTADLFEPDPECYTVLEQHFKNVLNKVVHLHPVAVSTENQDSVAFHKACANGLSGLSASPYGATEQVLSVPGVRLSDYLHEINMDHVDFLKIDVEGWDLEILKTHDFDAFLPRLVMVEASTAFENQTIEAINGGISWMEQYGFAPLIIQYEDDGNFRKGIWKYRLSKLLLNKQIEPSDKGDFLANILFYRKEDTVFLASLLKFLRSLLASNSPE
ncbi:MAG: FkbM family methyltransferase [Gammaproteobacteria bacterium]|nr:FkbM family methyltransferase [Gammaproteobacteria bacterium]